MLSGPRKLQRVAIFISGAGSTLQSFLDMNFQFDVRLVVSNKKNALGLKKAKRYGIPILILDTPIDYQKLHQILIQKKINRIFLAGFMKLIPESFINHWQGKIDNIHPSLLPDFPGLNAAESSWKHQKNMGVTLHKVIPEMDQGQKILQMESSSYQDLLSLNEAMLFLRRTEQHLLREYILKWSL